MSAAAASQKLHVGLNLIFLVPGETGGMEIYARELISAMRELDDAPQLTAFVAREAADSDEQWIHDLNPTVVPVHARNRFEWVRGEQQHLPRLAQRAGVDVLHSMANTAPLYGRFRRVTTIHDLIHLVHPEAHFGVLAHGLRVAVAAAAKRSHRIITVSQSTANDVRKHLKIPAERIDVVPNGVLPPPTTPLPTAAEVRRRFELGDRDVLLAASAKRPHKNLARLLDALAQLDRRPLLVLPGYPTEHEAELRAQASQLGLDDDVRFIGWLGSDDLEGLYAVSAGFIMPSLYEGFGLPVLEAMARGVPTACSNRSSLPEVAGDAALLFDPEDVPAIARAVDTLVHDKEAAERLRQSGPARALEFSWQRAAISTLAAYHAALRY